MKHEGWHFPQNEIALALSSSKANMLRKQLRHVQDKGVVGLGIVLCQNSSALGYVIPLDLRGNIVLFSDEYCDIRLVTEMIEVQDQFNLCLVT